MLVLDTDVALLGRYRDDLLLITYVLFSLIRSHALYFVLVYEMILRHYVLERRLKFVPHHHQLLYKFHFLLFFRLLLDNGVAGIGILL